MKQSNCCYWTQFTVQAFDTDTPGSPIKGQSWAIGATPTGAWSRQAGLIASWRGGGVSTPDLNNLAGAGINATSDVTNKLSIAADATLLNHDGNGHQLKLNKAAAADTASLLYQSGFSGRAENEASRAPMRVRLQYLWAKRCQPLPGYDVFDEAAAVHPNDITLVFG